MPTTHRPQPTGGHHRPAPHPRRAPWGLTLPLLAALALAGCGGEVGPGFGTATPPVLTPTGNLGPGDPTPTEGATATAPQATDPAGTSPAQDTPTAPPGTAGVTPTAPSGTLPAGETPTGAGFTAPPTAPPATPTIQGPTLPPGTPRPTPTPGPTPPTDADRDGYPAAQDCDDQNPAVHPGATERCNNLDDDCDGATDDQDPGLDPSTAQPWYQDNDVDGYGDSAISVIRCQAPSGYVANGGDCNDFNPAFHPGATESCTDPVDLNCDGAVGAVDNDSDGVAACEDCNDNNPAVYPSATEVCDAANLDEDCNGFADNSDQGTDPATKSTFWPDNDRDGYGDANHPGGQFCDAPTGYVPVGGDCNDAQPGVHPGATEICNGRDDDCDSLVDDGDSDLDASSATTFYADADADGYGAAASPVRACTRPSGTASNDDDCDDANPDVKPGASERCNEADDDCDTRIDEGAPLNTYYTDGDSDGYGVSASTVRACTRPAGTAAQGGDCDDTRPAVNPGATEVCDPSNVDENCNNLADNADSTTDPATKTTFYPDADRDTYGDANHPGGAFCDAPTGYVSRQGDCDDASAATNPGATEVCNGADDDCDGLTDDNDPSLSAGTADTWYRDSDEDGFGDAAVTQVACFAPNRYVATAGDCNDADPSVHPGATEVCNGRDDDCDGQIDDGAAPGSWYTDADGDTWGTGSPTVACEQPGGTAPRGGDCDDNNAAVHPTATEVCNGVDDNCTGGVDEGVQPATWYDDDDQDTYGDPADTQVACTRPTGYVSNNRDCDDTDSTIHPGASEVCNTEDDDCDSRVDEDAQPDTWYDDGDQDGYGDASDSTTSCTQPAGHVRNRDDCDDGNAAVHPGADERCNSIDDDCDQATDEAGAVDAPTWYADGDQDGSGDPAVTTSACSQPGGYVRAGGDCDDGDPTVHPGAAEDCNSADDDCDTRIDEGTSTRTFYGDGDGDGYGNAQDPRQSCVVCAGCADNASDCNDQDATIHPGAPELLDDKDNDCNGAVERDISLAQAHGSFTGAVNGGLLGFEVDIIGDFDGDGYDDIGMGAPRINNRAGGAYLAWGHGGAWSHQAVSAGTLRIDGTATEAEYGRAVTGGDLDGDGRGDLFLGAPKATVNAGQTREGGSISIIYGRSQRPGSGTVEDIEDSFSDGYFDEVQLGYAMDAHGDMTGDGIDDLLVGSPWYYITMSPPAGGYLFILPGQSLQYGGIFGIEGNVFIQFKGDNSQVLGLNATHIGDFNADGYGDVLGTGYGVIGSGLQKEEDVGMNYIIAGRDEDELPTGSGDALLASANGPARYYGDNDDDLVGVSAAWLGDINGDGEDDFAMGRARNNADEPLAFVFLGGSPVPGTGEAEEKADMMLFSSSGLRCPCTVGGLGDINTDGFDDLAVAVTDESGGGRLFILYGYSVSRDAAPSTVPVESTAAKILRAESAGDKAGFSISGRGDVNGDGRDDFVVSATGRDGAAGSDVGKVYVFLGYGG